MLSQQRGEHLKSVNRTAWKVLVMCVVLGPFVGAVSWASTMRDLTQYVPDGALLAVHVPSVPQLIEHWEDSPFYKFYGDARTAGFFRPVRGQIEQYKRRMLDHHQISPEQFTGFFNGGLVLAAMPASKGGSGPFEWLLLIEHNGDPRLIERFKVGPKSEGGRIERVTREYRGVDYQTIRLIREEKSSIPVGKSKTGDEKVRTGNQAARRQVVDEFDDYFGRSLIVHAGARGKPIHRVLELLADPESGPSLGADPALRELRETLDPDPDIEVYADLEGLARYYENVVAAAELGLDLKALHLDQLEVAMIKLDLRADRVVAELAVRGPEPRRGVSRLLFLIEGDGPQLGARLVPPETLIYTSTRLPLSQGWKILWEMAGEAMADFRETLEPQMEALGRGAGIDLETQLFGQLGSDLVRFVLPGGGRRGRSEPSTYVIGLRDGRVFGEALDALLRTASRTFGGFFVEESQVRGRTTLTLYSGRPELTTPGSTRALMHMCSTDRWFIAGRRRDGIEAVLERLDADGVPVLRDKPTYQDVMGQLPADRCAESYADIGGIARWLARGLPPGVLPSSLPGGGGASDGGAGLVAPFMTPATDVWGEYFGPVASARRIDGDTFRMQIMMLYP